MFTDLLTHAPLPVFAQQTRGATLDVIGLAIIVLANALPLLVFAAL